MKKTLIALTTLSVFASASAFASESIDFNKVELSVGQKQHEFSDASSFAVKAEKELMANKNVYATAFYDKSEFHWEIDAIGLDEKIDYDSYGVNLGYYVPLKSEGLVYFEGGFKSVESGEISEFAPVFEIGYKRVIADKVLLDFSANTSFYEDLNDRYELSASADYIFNKSFSAGVKLAYDDMYEDSVADDGIMTVMGTFSYHF